MILTTEKLTFDTQLVIPAGDLHMAISPEGAVYVCDMSVDENYIVPAEVEWEFMTVYNRLETVLNIKAGTEVKTAEDMIGNTYTLIKP